MREMACRPRHQRFVVHFYVREKRTPGHRRRPGLEGVHAGLGIKPARYARLLWRILIRVDVGLHRKLTGSIVLKHILRVSRIPMDKASHSLLGATETSHPAAVVRAYGPVRNRTRASPCS